MTEVDFYVSVAPCSQVLKNGWNKLLSGLSCSPDSFLKDNHCSD